jgi:hypothetical protein
MMIMVAAKFWRGNTTTTRNVYDGKGGWSIVVERRDAWLSSTEQLSILRTSGLQTDECVIAPWGVITIERISWIGDHEAHISGWLNQPGYAIVSEWRGVTIQYDMRTGIR